VEGFFFNALFDFDPRLIWWGKKHIFKNAKANIFSYQSHL